MTRMLPVLLFVLVPAFHAHAQTRAPAAPADSASTLGAKPAQDPAPASTARLRARFVDEAGAPLRGVGLVWRPDKAVSDEVLVTSGADGACAIQIPWTFESDTRWVSLWTKAAGRACAQFNPKLEKGQLTDLGTVTLGPGGTISGVVRDRSGRPLARATLSVIAVAKEDPDLTPSAERRPDRDATLAFGSSAADGTYRIEGVPLGSVSVWAHHDSTFWQGRSRIGVAAGADTGGIDFALDLLPPERIIEGRVLTPDGKPFAGAMVDTSIHDPTQDQGDTGVSIGCHAVTDADGRFRLYLALPSEEELGLTAKDPSENLAEASASALGGARNVVIRLVAQHDVGLFVHDSAGQPVETFGWTLELGGSYMWMLTGMRAAAHAGGRATVTIPESEFTIEVEAPGYETRKLGPFLSASPPVPIDVALTAFGRVHASVWFEGRPVEGASVESLGGDFDYLHELIPAFNTGVYDIFPDEKAVTDAQGEFSIATLSSTTLARAWKKGYAESVPVLIKKGEDSVRIELRKPSLLRGTIKPGGEVHAEDVRLELCRKPKNSFDSDDDRSPVFRCGPQTDGTYEFDSLAPGPWLLFVHGPPGTDPAFKDDEDAPPFVVTVPAGATASFDVDMSKVARNTLEGSLDVDGKRIRDGSVVLYAMGDPWIEAGVGYVHDDGLFEVALRQPGEYRLVLHGGFGGRESEGTAVDVVTLTGERTEWRRSTDATTWSGGGVKFAFR